MMVAVDQALRLHLTVQDKEIDLDRHRGAAVQ